MQEASPMIETPTPSLSYPEEIENWWWKKAIEKWPDASDTRKLNLFREEITIQSDLFNKTRDFSTPNYGSRDLSILAYGNFFFPRTWMQNSFVLAEAIELRGWKAPRKGPLRILDLGSGSGSAGLAALHLLRKRGIANPIELQAIDNSSKSLTCLRGIHADNRRLWPKSSIKTKRLDLKKGLALHHAYDLVLLSSSLNEISSGEHYAQVTRHLAEIGNLLKPSGFLVVVEPALKTLCHRLHRAARQLVESEDLYLHGPYFNGLACPFLSSKSKYHSHEVRQRTPPDNMRKLNEQLGLNVEDIKFGFILVSKKEPIPLEQNASVLRLVSPVSKRKGAYRFVGVGGDGHERSYEMQVRNLEEEDQVFMEGMERGDVLRLLEWDSLDGDKRVRISNTKAVEVLWSPNS